MKYAINYEGRPRRGRTYPTAADAQAVINWSLSAEAITRPLIGRPFTVFWLERRRAFSPVWKQLRMDSGS